MKLEFLKNFQLSWPLAAGIYAVIFLTILILAYVGYLPTHLDYIPCADKIGHVVLYALATYLGHRVVSCRPVCCRWVTVPFFPLLFGLFTVTEEALQALSPYRTLDAMDLVASFLGIGLGYWLADRTKNKIV